MTGASAETTTYDKIFSTLKAIEAIMEAKGIKDASKVSAKMLADASRKVRMDACCYLRGWPRRGQLGCL